MSIHLPEQLHFDPYHESGIIITRTAEHIVMELPRNYLGNLPGFIIGGAWILGSLFLSLYGLTRLQWGFAAFGILFGAVGGMPVLVAFYLASQRATLELAPDHLAITPLGWGQDATPRVMAWDEIADVHIGFVPPNYEERANGLVFTLRGKPSQLALSGRPVGELERLRDFLKPLLISTQ